MNIPFKFGIVSEAKPGFAKVYFQEDDIVTAWWPVLTRTSLLDKESWTLNVKEHIVCLCDEHCEEGVVLGCIASEVDPVDPAAGDGKFRRLFEDGTYIEYDKGAHKLTAFVKGSVEISATNDIEATTITNIKASALMKATIQSPDIQLVGNVTVVGMITAAGITAAPMPAVPGATGKITAAADIETTGTIKGADVLAGTTSLSLHVHTAVQPGSGTSGPPVP